jgi:hypothetical protein
MLSRGADLRFTAAMGKLDDMRRQREAQYAGADAVVADKAAAEATSGRCASCRKTLALQHDGLIGSHQKGLGKFCPGSRKPPA